jgi:F0F1-type ATP synthase assembly protein I
VQTLVKAGINPHSIHPLGATRTKGTKTLKGAITTNAKGEILLKLSTLVLFVVCTVITLTIAPRFLISRG